MSKRSVNYGISIIFIAIAILFNLIPDIMNLSGQKWWTVLLQFVFLLLGILNTIVSMANKQPTSERAVEDLFQRR